MALLFFIQLPPNKTVLHSKRKTLFDALDKTGKYYVVIMPNNDPGVKAIKKELDGLDKSRFRILPSMRFKYFSCLLQNANILISNSSTGVRSSISRCSVS